MPPEPYPWDRRDFRKHERSGAEPRFGGGYGGGWPPRWRDLHHHDAQPPPYRRPYYQQQHPRWYSDVRSSPLPPGHGKQAGWHMHPDEVGQGFLPYGSRFSDRNLDEENFRTYNMGSDGVRHLRNYRDNRGSFSQKYWRATSREPVASSDGPGRNVENNEQRPIEHAQAHNSCAANNRDENNFSHPTTDEVTSEKPDSISKEQPLKDGGNVDELGSSRKYKKETCLGSINWKPLKWSRSGSLSSKGSSLSRSSSSKSLGVDSIETAAEVQQKKLTPVQSPTADALMTFAATSSEEPTSRKKPRLGWGEGLAKYEKKIVDDPEDDAIKSTMVVSFSNIEETEQAHTMNILEKSQRVADLEDCMSPVISVACSSSPGIEEKETVNGAKVDHGTSNCSCSPSTVSQAPFDGPKFNVENLELSSLSRLSSLVCELLQSGDQSCVNTYYVGADKLFLWKSDISKALEMTECEIDSLETELKSFIPEPKTYCPPPNLSSLQPEEIRSKRLEEQETDSNFAFRLAPLQPVSSECMIVENAPIGIESVEHERLNVDHTDNTGCASSKCVQVSTSLEDFYPQTSRGLVNLDANISSNLVEEYPDNSLCDGKNTGHADYSELTVTKICPDLSGTCDMLDIYDSILLSNKDFANVASEALNKLLPSGNNILNFGMGSSVSCLQGDLAVIRKNFLRRKRFLSFKEKTLTLKYKLFQHFWLQGRLVSVRKLRALSHKKPDLIEHKKHRFSRTRISAAAGNSQTVLAEVIDFVSGLLSESSFKPYRNTLKMPALILDEKEMQISRFISNNGLVEDPCAVETERSMINTWTSEERETFIDKLAKFGKDFRKIASFLDHKTTAECVEFYYKNHKSDCFEKARKKPDVKRSKSHTTYMVASGKRWGRDAAAASLDILGAASAMVANASTVVEIHQKCMPGFSFGASNAHKASRSYDGPFRRLNSPDLYNNEREAVAAVVLAGICDSMSPEAVSSCVKSSVDPVDRNQDLRSQRVGFYMKRPSTLDVTLTFDDECSDESCGKLDSTDWSDVEKTIFIQSLSSYGRDFEMISQCVGTRSRDQCKVFFSKARKCLGLDLILPGRGNAISRDANGGGSDVEDASAMGTGSIVCNVGSDCKMEDHLLQSDIKSRHEYDRVESKRHVKLGSKKCEENNWFASRDPVDTDPLSKNSLMGNCHLDNHVMNFNVDIVRENGANGVCVSLQELGTMDVSSDEETVRMVEEAADRSLQKESSEAENMALVEVSGGRLGKNCQEPDLLSTDKKVVDADVNSTDISGINGMVNGMKSELQLSENASLPLLDVHSATQANDVSFKKKDALETYTEKSHVDPLEQNSHIASLTSSTLFSVPIRYQKLSNHHTLSAVGVDWVDDEQSRNTVGTGDCEQYLSAHTFSDPCQFLRGSTVPGPILSEEKNGSVSCKNPIPLQNFSHGNLDPAHRAGFSLQKCRSLRYHSHDEASDPLRQHSGGQSGTRPSCSSNMDKPFRNGDVKLFGKILTSSEQKSHSCGQRTDDSGGQHHKSNDPGSENIPVMNFGFQDRNRMQTGLPPMANSSLLLAKYPSAFSNYAMSPAKVEQPPFQRLVKRIGRSSNCVSLFPSRDLCNRNGLTDILKSREARPFTTDMNPKDIFITDVQRRNRLNVVSGMQQQSRGIVGINVGRGVLVGGQCSGVSDPVAGIKMHYAKSEQFSLQSGNMMKEDRAWRRKGT
ncbi:hypothetical protein F511_01755 [Dorcoceras hygrometricum]|uniref:SANT domain-containing protein n=1 Tax=Dorcoceras hygrometricum TaxID=472368 RepID=A0A2Z7AS37_9LAMI|nr:hypothetical protein F511_01755 [Dorcoceras hygrometricum]